MLFTARKFLGYLDMDATRPNSYRELKRTRYGNKKWHKCMVLLIYVKQRLWQQKKTKLIVIPEQYRKYILIEFGRGSWRRITWTQI